jgi:hypothetical protein
MFHCIETIIILIIYFDSINQFHKIFVERDGIPLLACGQGGLKTPPTGWTAMCTGGLKPGGAGQGPPGRTRFYCVCLAEVMVTSSRGTLAKPSVVPVVLAAMLMMASMPFTTLPKTA